jgi:hypothetical protein
MTSLYDDVEQEGLHVKAMQLLAVETGKEFALVRVVYEKELTRLLAEAKVRDFLSLLVSRHARDTLKKLASPASQTSVVT